MFFLLTRHSRTFSLKGIKNAPRFLSLYIHKIHIPLLYIFPLDFLIWSSPLWLTVCFYHPVIYYILSSRSCTSQTRSCSSRLTAIMAIRRNRCTSSGTVRKSSSRVKASRSQAQGRTLRLFGTDLMRHAIIRLHSPRVIYCLILYRLYLLCFVYCEWLQAEFLPLICNSYVSTRLFERLTSTLFNY